MYKWMGITLGIGVLLVVLDYSMAKKKKEGFTPTDRQRLVGVLWLSVFFALLVGWVIWMSSD
ncbi:MAG TPA: hypothetical protein VF871_01080 [Burkholderiales bacterium]